MDIKEFKDKHKGETCYILCNGTSLNDVDLDLLKDEVTFGVNKIFLKGFTPTYYVAVNPLVIEQSVKQIEALDCPRFLPYTEARKFPATKDHPDPAIVSIDTSFPLPSFQTRLDKGPMWEGHTVTFVCLQLAYWMGFERVIILGMDHDYGEVLNPNAEAKAFGPDKHHFDENYFAEGQSWNLPDLQMSEIAYSLARQAFEGDRRRVINASSYSKCNVFERQPLNTIIGASKPDVSAIVSAYHAEKFLGGCLSDLMAQTMWEADLLEILVVCKQGSKEHQIAKRHKGIAIVTTEDIPTVYEAWNLGVRAASGKYLTNANTDDRRHPGSMELQVGILDGNPSVDLVYHDQYITWKPNQTYDEFVAENNGKTLVGGRFENEPGIFAWADFDPRTMIDGCYIGPQPMWRASLHQRFGLFDTEFKSAGDYEFWLRCVRGGSRFLHIPIPLGLYLARLDGIELSDPALNGTEFGMARVRYSGWRR
jgi:hypothetical protein